MEQLKPLLKYPGGKSSEWEIIKNNLPSNMNNYIEPFVGGGAVYFLLENNNHNYINDKSKELMLLYKYVKTKNKTFFKELDTIISNWEFLTNLSKQSNLYDIYIEFRNEDIPNIPLRIDEIISNEIFNEPMFNLRNNEKFREYLIKCLHSKFLLLKKNEIKKERFLNTEELKSNIEAGIKSAYYSYLRDIYNNSQYYKLLSDSRKVAIYFFIREYCYSSMFRFNSDGKFNVPYGGLSYNKKSLKSKVEYFKSKNLNNLLKNTELCNLDFYDFLSKIEIDKNDFMFLDPPYDTTFSEYDKNSFNASDQIRLANYLINECKCRFMLVIKKTNFIENLYKDKGLKIIEEDKAYFVSFKNRNEKKVKHLIIMNY